MTALSIRKTHKYVGTWADLDEWEDIGTVEELHSSSRIVDEEDPCQPTETLVEVRVDAPGRKKPEIIQALYSTFSRHGCDHEYDCCGCWSWRVTDTPRRREHHENHWVFHMYSSRNY